MMRPLHPGQVLASCFNPNVPLEDSAIAAAERMGLDYDELLPVLRGQAPITRKLALQLNSVLPEHDPKIWLELQLAYDCALLQDCAWCEEIVTTQRAKSAALTEHAYEAYRRKRKHKSKQQRSRKSH